MIELRFNYADSRISREMRLFVFIAYIRCLYLIIYVFLKFIRKYAAKIPKKPEISP